MNTEQLFLIVLVVAVSIWLALDWWRSKNSTYYRLLAELTKKLELAEFSSEHPSAQDYRAKLAWLRAIRIKKLGEKGSNSKYDKMLAGLETEELRFPEKLDCRRPFHLEYADILVQALAGLFTSGGERHFRSQEELPYPISEILRGADALLEHVERTDAQEEPIFPKGYASNLRTLTVSLRNQYLPLPKATLACSGRENLRVGLDYKRQAAAAVAE